MVAQNRQWRNIFALSLSLFLLSVSTRSHAHPSQPILVSLFSLRIPEGQAEAGSLAAGRLRSLEDQLTRAKQKIHSFQKLTGDGKQARDTFKKKKKVVGKEEAPTFNLLQLSSDDDGAGPSDGQGHVCVCHSKQWSEGQGRLLGWGGCVCVWMKGKQSECLQWQRRKEREEKRGRQRENKKGHVSVEGSTGSAFPSCRRGRKS